MSGLGPDPGEAMDRWGATTPGPWDYAGAMVFAGQRFSESHRIVATTSDTDRFEADARLISKAWLLPRLEAALRDITDHHNVSLPGFGDDEATDAWHAQDLDMMAEARALLAELAKP